MIKQHRICIPTNGRATIEITAEVERLVAASTISRGICHVFVEHTSASLIITENADGDVRRDLENYLSQLVADGDPAYLHSQEGDDDMAAHIRSVLTQTEASIPVSDARLSLGTWQGLYLWEHRYRGHRRNITITLIGDND